jgi:hypothetical protein
MANNPYGFFIPSHTATFGVPKANNYLGPKWERKRAFREYLTERLEKRLHGLGRLRRDDPWHFGPFRAAELEKRRRDVARRNPPVQPIVEDPGQGEAGEFPGSTRPIPDPDWYRHESRTPDIGKVPLPMPIHDTQQLPANIHLSDELLSSIHTPKPTIPVVQPTVPPYQEYDFQPPPAWGYQGRPWPLPVSAASPEDDGIYGDMNEYRYLEVPFLDDSGKPISDFDLYRRNAWRGPQTYRGGPEQKAEPRYMWNKAEDMHGDAYLNQGLYEGVTPIPQDDPVRAAAAATPAAKTAVPPPSPTAPDFQGPHFQPQYPSPWGSPSYGQIPLQPVGQNKAYQGGNPYSSYPDYAAAEKKYLDRRVQIETEAIKKAEAKAKREFEEREKKKEGYAAKKREAANKKRVEDKYKRMRERQANYWKKT